jgi:CheY-like chemotaxis protein
MRVYLESAGFRMATAGDGQAALTAYRHEKPALVILDLGLLGLDPLYVAHEGNLVAIVAAEAALAALRAQQVEREAAVIGRVTEAHLSRVVLWTALGARRVVDMLTGEQLPRICSERRPASAPCKTCRQLYQSPRQIFD